LRFEVAGNLTNVAETLRRSLNQGKAYADSWKKYNEEFAKYQDELKAYEALVAKQAAEEAKAKAEADAKAAADAKTAGEGKDAAEEKKPAGGDPDRGPESKEGTPGTPAKEVPEKATPAEGDKSKDSSDGDPAKSPGEKTAGAATPATASPDAEAAKTPDKPKEPTKPREVPNLEPYRAVFSGELPIIVVANDANSIELAVELFAKEFKLPTIIAGAREADRALPALKHELVSVAVGPDLIVRRENEKINLPQQLATAGIAFGFQSSAATGASRLPDAIAAATYRGLAVADALESITEAPADFLKLGSIGKLASGYDADLVVLSGSPFDLGTEVLAVMIDGKWVFMKEAK
jgi:hypothetical protein